MERAHLSDLASAPVGLPQHPDEHRPQRPITLAVDRELGDGAALWVAPELADPVGPLEVGSSRTWRSSGRAAGQGVEAFSESAFDLLQVHGSEARPRVRRNRQGHRRWRA
jgi:hypothetical protein